MDKGFGGRIETNPVIDAVAGGDEALLNSLFMPIIPTVRCSRISTSISFYTKTLDFAYVGGDEHQGDPSFHVLGRDGDLLFLSSHRGDGVYGQAIAVLTDDVDALFRKFRLRGLVTPGNPEAPSEVHEGPIDQSWGTREFYVQDPDGNCLRFTKGFSATA